MENIANLSVSHYKIISEIKKKKLWKIFFSKHFGFIIYFFFCNVSVFYSFSVDLLKQTFETVLFHKKKIFPLFQLDSTQFKSNFLRIIHFSFQCCFDYLLASVCLDFDVHIHMIHFDEFRWTKIFFFLVVSIKIFFCSLSIITFDLYQSILHHSQSFVKWLINYFLFSLSTHFFYIFHIFFVSIDAYSIVTSYRLLYHFNIHIIIAFE